MYVVSVLNHAGGGQLKIKHSALTTTLCDTDLRLITIPCIHRPVKCTALWRPHGK